MTEVYTVIYQTRILTEYCKKWYERPNVYKLLANFQMNFTDVKQKVRRSKKQTEKHTGFHGVNAVLMEKLERQNNTLIKIADGNDGQGANHNTHVKSSRVH